MAETTVSVKVSSRIEWIDAVEALAVDLAHDMGFSEPQRFDISLAVREALNNAIIHGNRGDASKRIWVNFGLASEALSVRVRDEGGGYRADEIPDPTRAENLLKSSGRGVFYIKNVMDEVDLSRTSKAGGEIFMVKRRGPREGERPGTD